MTDKDFRYTGTSNAEADGFTQYLEQMREGGSRPVTEPVQFFDKPQYPDTKEIKYTEDGRPISPRYDETHTEENFVPKAPSPAQEPAATSQSVTDPASVPGLEDIDSVQNQETSASAEKETNQESAVSTPPSLPTMPLPTGKIEPSAGSGA